MGVNDTITSSRYLQMEFGFTDGDYRTQKLPDPKNNLTSAEVSAVDTWIAANQPIIGDKYGASTTGINSASIVEVTRRKFDLT